MNRKSISKHKTILVKVINFLENYLDQRAVKTAKFRKGRDFEKIASELEI